MAAGQRGVSVAGEDDLALLGELEAAVDRALGLREDGAVCRAATAADGTAAAVHEDEVDVVLLGPLGDGGLRGVQDQRGAGGAGVLGGVGVAEHDLQAAARLGHAALDLGELDHLVKGLDGVLQVLHLLEERDDVEHGHVGLVREGKVGKLVDVGDVLGALGEGDDVAGCRNAILALDLADGAEGVQHLAGHGRELAALAPAAVLADVGEGAGVDQRVLAELHLHHVEAEGLGLPDELLDGAVGRSGGTRLGQRELDAAQVGDVVLGAGVHDVGGAHDGGAQALGNDQHAGAVQLGGRDADGAGRDGLAHLALVVPEVDQLVGGRRGGHVQRQVAADEVRGVGQRLHHVDAELLGHLAAHLCGDVGVAVAVGANPAARVEERGADGRHGAGLLAKLPVVKAAVDLGHHLEESTIEDVDDGVGLLHGSRLLVGDGRGAHQGVDLLQELALVLGQGDATQLGALLQQAGDAADLALDGLAAGLGGVGGKDRVELEAVEKGHGLAAAALVHELAVGHRDVVDGVGLGRSGHGALAQPQGLVAVVLLADVGEVEVGHEGAHQHGGVGLVQTGDDALQVGKGLGRLLGGAVIVVARLDGVIQKDVKSGAHLGIALLEDLAHQAQEERHVVADGLRNVHGGERGLGGRLLDEGARGQRALLDLGRRGGSDCGDSHGR